MKRWLKRTLISTFGATLLVGGLGACSYRHHASAWHEGSDDAESVQTRARMVDRIGSRFDLDANQRGKLTALVEQVRIQRQALLGSTDPRADVQAFVAGATFDRAKAKDFIDTKASTLQGKSPELIAALGDFYDSLKPDQQQKVRDLLSRGRHGWGR
jgi:Spy/CpxP family protein refolding chaperone